MNIIFLYSSYDIFASTNNFYYNVELRPYILLVACLKKMEALENMSKNKIYSIYCSIYAPLKCMQIWETKFGYQHQNMVNFITLVSTIVNMRKTLL